MTELGASFACVSRTNEVDVRLPNAISASAYRTRPAMSHLLGPTSCPSGALCFWCTPPTTGERWKCSPLPACPLRRIGSKAHRHPACRARFRSTHWVISTESAASGSGCSDSSISCCSQIRGSTSSDGM